MWENTTPSTELPPDFCAGIGPLQLGVVLVPIVIWIDSSGSRKMKRKSRKKRRRRKRRSRKRRSWKRLSRKRRIVRRRRSRRIVIARGRRIFT